MNYKALIFDFFGVVATDMYISWLTKNKLAAQIPNLKETHFQHSDTGTISPQELHAHLATNVGRTVPEIENELRGQFSLNQELATLIKSLHPKFKIALCSNAPTGIVEDFLQANNASSLFDAVVVSSSLGMRKPGKAIFDETLKRLGVNAQEAIFIDDIKENVIAARQLGMHSILYTNTADLKQAFSLLIKW